MTAPHSQPDSREAYQHVCADVECIYLGQRTSPNQCKCHKTREQMMAARIEELTKLIGWRPIDTAPQETVVLVCHPNEGRMPVIAWRVENDWFQYGFYSQKPLDPQPRLWLSWPKIPPKDTSPMSLEGRGGAT